VFDFDLIYKLLGGVLSPLVTRVGEAWEKRVFKGKEGLADGGTAEQRFAAYESLRRACVEVRTVLDVLWSLPTGFTGGLVALSIIRRLLHRIPTLAVAVNDAFLGVAMVGRGESIEAAQALAMALQSVIKQHERPASGRPRRSAVVTDWSDFDQALGGFVAASRSDLGIQPLGEH
jgi:hypothetical protein